MNNLRTKSSFAARKSHMMEILAGAAAVVIAIGIVVTMAKSENKNNEAEALRKLQAIGTALRIP